MVDLALGSVDKVIKLLHEIKKTVETVHQNEEDCEEIENLVARLVPNLQNMEATRLPGMNDVLVGFQKTLEGALKVATDWQGRNAVSRFLGASKMSRQMDRILGKIEREMMQVMFVQVTIVTSINIRRCSCAPPAFTQPQNAGEVETLYGCHSATMDARSGMNSEITMIATGSEVPNVPLSGSGSFSLEASTRYFSEEHITGEDGQSFVRGMKQKIVIKVCLPSDRCRSKAMALVAAVNGVSSMGITGDLRDSLEVVGNGVDCVCLVQRLRKKVGHAEILKVEEVKDKNAQPVVVNTEEAPPGDNTTNRGRRTRRNGIRAIITKLSKFVWRRHGRRSISRPPPSPQRVEHMDSPAPAARGGPRSQLFSDVSPSTATGAAASPPATSSSARLLPLGQPARNTRSSDSPRSDLPPVTVAPPVRVRRRRRRTFDMSRVRRSARLAATRRLPMRRRAQGDMSRNAGPTHDEPATVEAGYVLEDYVAMFDGGPLPPAVIAAITGPLLHLHLDGEGPSPTSGSARIEHGTVEMQ